MQTYDGVVIGAGHNGLTLAAYMARAGLKIAVLERNARIGGGASTEEPALPGYRFNLHSNFFMGFRHSPLLRDLELLVSASPISSRRCSRARRSAITCVVIHKIWTRPALRSRTSPSATPRRSVSCTTPTASACARCSRLWLSMRRCRSTSEGPPFGSAGQGVLVACPARPVQRGAQPSTTTGYARFSRLTCMSSPPRASRARVSCFPLIFANVMEFTLPVGGAVSFPLALQRLIEAHGGAVITGLT